MIKKLSFLLVSLFLINCSGLKNSQESLAKGNYDLAINKSLNYLQKNRYGKKAPEYNQLLFESYNKAVARDQRNIDFLNQDVNAISLEKKFKTLVELDRRQNKIRPILPIDGYNFEIKNYISEIVDTRNQLSEHLYQKANNKFLSNNKQFVREAHDDFRYIQKINPDYKDVPELIVKTREKGMDFVLIDFRNQTDKLIPTNLAEDLLNLEEYNLNNYWVTYDNSYNNNTTYDYIMLLTYNNISISPEQTKETIVIKEKKIKDGKEYVLDNNGNVKKDDKGNDITKDRYTKITCSFHQFHQTKNCYVKATASFLNYNTKQVLSKYPLESEFIFKHYYASKNGDSRALPTDFINMLKNKRVVFPTNSQMIFDTSNDVKSQLQNILTNPRY